ncbi:hypothetical protein D3C72_2370550 [compost metagenome]
MVADAQHRRYQLAGCDLLVMMLGPQLLEARQPVRVVLHRVAFAVALRTIESNQRRQSKRQASRELTCGLLPCQ